MSNNKQQLPPISEVDDLAGSPPHSDGGADIPASPVAFDTAANTSHLSLKEQMEMEQRKLNSARGAQDDKELKKSKSRRSSTIKGKRRSVPSIRIEGADGKQDAQQEKEEHVKGQKIRLSHRRTRDKIAPNYRRDFTRERFRVMRRTFREFDRDEDGIVTSSDISSFLEWGESKTVDVTTMMRQQFNSEEMTFAQFVELMMDNEHIFDEFLNGTRTLKDMEKIRRGMYSEKDRKRRKRRRRRLQGRKHGLVMDKDDIGIIGKLKKRQKSRMNADRKRRERRQVMRRLIPQQRRPSMVPSIHDSAEPHIQSDRARSKASRTVLPRQPLHRPSTTPHHGSRAQPKSQSLENPQAYTRAEFSFAPKINPKRPHPSSASYNHDEHPFAVPDLDSRIHSVFAPGGKSLLDSKGNVPKDLSFRSSHRKNHRSKPQQSRPTDLKKKFPPQTESKHSDDDRFDTGRRKDWYDKVQQNISQFASDTSLSEMEKSLQKQNENDTIEAPSVLEEEDIQLPDMIRMYHIPNSSDSTRT